MATTNTASPVTQQKRTRAQASLWRTALRRRVVKLAVSDHKLWTHCRYKAPDTEVRRGPRQRDDHKQFVAKVGEMRWGKRQEALLKGLATSVREGLTLDTSGMWIHLVGGEDVRLAPAGRTEERVYMPTTLAHFGAAHRAVWATQSRPHQRLVAAGVAGVQEY